MACLTHTCMSCNWSEFDNLGEHSTKCTKCGSDTIYTVHDEMNDFPLLGGSHCSSEYEDDYQERDDD